MLKTHGVSYYEYQGLRIYFAPRESTVHSQASVPTSYPEERTPEDHTIGYRHPSLKLFSWPEAKEEVRPPMPTIPDEF